MNARYALFRLSLCIGPFLVLVAVATAWIKVYYEAGGADICWQPINLPATTFRPRPLLPGVEFGQIINSGAPRETVGWVASVHDAWLFGIFAAYPALASIYAIARRVLRTRPRSAPMPASSWSVWRAATHWTILGVSTWALVALIAVRIADLSVERAYGDVRRSFGLRDGQANVQFPIGPSGSRWQWPSANSALKRVGWIYAVRSPDVNNHALDLDSIAVFVTIWPFAVLFSLYAVVGLMRGPGRRYLRERRGLCLNCGYDLTGNTSGRCTECGASNDSRDNRGSD